MQSSDLSPEKNRGDYYILVYKNIGNPETVVQIEAGYDYKIGPNIMVNIDKGIYLFIQLRTTYSSMDKRMITKLFLL